MKNSLNDLHNHLFEQLERLNDDDLSGEELEKEIKRSKAITSVAKEIIDNAKIALDSQKFIEENYCRSDQDKPKLIGMSDS